MTVSIGIPAYNEEANIKKLILSLLDQKENEFNLAEVLVVSDGSTDNTEKNVLGIKSNKIKLIKNKKRLGLAAGQNKITELFVGEVLIILNADVLPSSDLFIENLIKPFQYKDVALIGPRIVPVKASNFFEKIINYSVEFKDSMGESWKEGNNLLLCRGAGRAFSREFAKKIYWEESLSEDAYSYLLCKKMGYRFNYNRSAKLYFKSPDNFSDHVKQSARFTGGPEVMSKYFDKESVISEYKLPRGLVFKSMWKYFWKNPILFTSYLSIFLLIKINPNKSKYSNSKWELSKSSKKITI